MPPSSTGTGLYAFGIVAAGMYGFQEDDVLPEADGVRYIDSLKRDYAVSGTEILKTTRTRQRVLNLVQSAFGSSLATRGVRMPEYHGPGTARYMDREVRAALRPLVDEGTIVINAIASTIFENRKPGSLGVDIDYTDTQTGRRETVFA